MTTSETVSRTVSDFMPRKVKVITENETMRQACKLMYQHNIGSIIIVKNDDGKSNDTTKKEIPVGIGSYEHLQGNYERSRFDV